MDSFNDKSAQPISSNLYTEIQADILSGKFPNHQKLTEQAICKKYGVSRTPVREALRQLELEGLVKIVPNKGAVVTSINAKDIKDIYKMRSMLEGLCARWATRYITEEQIDELEEVIFLSEYYLNKKSQGKAAQMTEMDGKFHLVLYQAANSRMLGHVLRDFHKYVQVARTMSVRSEDRAKKSIEEHKAILEAIKAKDEDRAEMLAHEHIMHVIQNLHIEE